LQIKTMNHSVNGRNPSVSVQELPSRTPRIHVPVSSFPLVLRLMADPT
jgi:hypothetical protein